MATANVKIQYVNQPKEGKSWGSIKTVDGKYYGVKQAMLSQFAKGQSYDIEYSSKTTEDGRELRSVDKVLATAASGGGSVGANDRAIFITGVVGRAMGSGQYPISELSMLTLAAADAWDALQARAKPPEKPKDELNDEIPW